MKSIENLIGLLKNGTSQYHSVLEAKRQLKERGFQELAMRDEWKLTKGSRYFLCYGGSTLLAFTVGEHFLPQDSFRIAAAHGDFPGFRLKPNAGMENGGYLQLNTEGYGGAILSSWFDRPLSVAGKVALRTKKAFEPEIRYIDMKKPLLTIPNLAIHFNREVNKGVELKKQKDMLPIYGISSGALTKDAFLNLLASELGVDTDAILDYELTIYNTDEPCYIGMGDEMLSAPRLDNLTSVQAILDGLADGERKYGINMMVVFDHEEVGSCSKQGAASTLLPAVLEKIYASFGYTRMQFLSAMEDGLFMSVDVSHAFHPNYADRYDITNHHVLGHGFAIKEAAGQSYATDSEAIAIVQQICDEENISYQKFVKHSDNAGGGTLGAIASAMLPIRTVDIGVPLLAMHSARETMGVADYESLQSYLKFFFAKN